MSDIPSVRESLEQAVSQVGGEASAQVVEAPAAPSAPSAGPAETAAAAETPVTEPVKADRPRDAAGRFIQKDAAPEVLPEQKGAALEEAKPAAEKAAEKAPEKAPELIPALTTLPAAEKAELSKLPPEAQQIFARHYHDIRTHMIRVHQEYAPLKPIAEIFAPHMNELARAGTSPAQVIQRWAAAEELLQKDAPQALQWLASTYLNQQDPDHLAVLQALQGAAGEQQFVDPVVAELRRENAELKARVDHVGGYLQNQHMGSVASQIEAFATAKDASGQLAHPHLDAVADDMAARVKFIRAQGGVPDLQSLYDDAVWANPTLRTQMIAAQAQQQIAAATAASAAKAQEDARTQAAKAARAGASVRSAPGVGVTAVKPQTIRETLEANWRAAGGAI